MTSNCCSQCCLAYFCCCCLELDGKQKYANVSYSSIKDKSLQHKSDENWMSPSSIVDSMDKLFTFPQQQVDSPLHPQMFSDMELSDPVTNQPIARRFSLQSLTGADYGECVTGLNAEVRKKLQRSASIADYPQRKMIRSSKRSFSLPATNSPTERQISTSAKSNVQSTSSPQDQQDNLSGGKSDSSWVLGLPIMEENDIAGQDDKPTVQFSLYYDIQLSMLTVHLHRASNLPAKDRQGTSDPFVVVYLSPNKEESFQSKVMYRTLNPVFDQSFQFKRLTPDEIRRQTLILRIYDHDRFTHNDSIGMVTLPLENADLYGVVMRMIIQDIEEEKQQIGKILIALSYDPQLSMLKGVVLKVAELRKQDLVGLADPYIKINLMHKGKRKKKWKSTVKRNTLAPVFNESFQFEISKDMNISDIHMEVLLMDYDRFSRNDVIGVILIGENINHTTGRKHWIDILQSPRQSVSHWHSVMPSKL